MTLGYLKARKIRSNSQPPNSLYKTREHGFSLKGREIKMVTGNTEISLLFPQLGRTVIRL
jgi:hypothetical protein